MTMSHAGRATKAETPSRAPAPIPRKPMSPRTVDTIVQVSVIVALAAFWEFGARFGAINPFLLWSASSFGASRAAVMREVVLPAAMPDILNGCRTALAFSFILMVSSEFVIATDGVGYMISSLGDGGLYPAMFAAIFFVAAIGFAADRLYAALVRKLLRWREA